jgi:HEAT repeat protein
MTKSLTIELPDDLTERLGTLSTTSDASLKELILQTIQLLATSIQSLQDEDPTVRANAARMLGFIGTESAVPALGQTLQDEDLVVRQAAVDALRHIGTESALALLSQQSSETPVAAHDDAVADPLSALIGTLHLGTTDLAEHHDRYLADSLEQELNPSE